MLITELRPKSTVRVADFPTYLGPTLPPIYTPISSSPFSFVSPDFFRSKQQGSSIIPLTTDSSKIAAAQVTCAAKILTYQSSLKVEKDEESKVPHFREPTHNRATDVMTLDEYSKEELDAYPPDRFVFNELCEDSCRFYDNFDKLSAIIDPALLDLRLCRCTKMSSELRACLENTAIDYLIAHHDQNSLLTIVSVGAGGCYQELTYLARLAKAGYHNIQLVVIEKKPVHLESLKTVCRKYLPQCRIDVIYYPSLETYKKDASQSKHIMKPNLLLLLDLTDEDCKINKKPLPDFSFELFNKYNILQKKTVIAWNIMDDTRDEEEPLLSIGLCGLYDETSETLSKISQKKIAGTHRVLGNSERPRYKRIFSAITK